MPCIDYHINFSYGRPLPTANVHKVCHSIKTIIIKGIYNKCPIKDGWSHTSETLLGKVFPQILWEHSNDLMENVPTSLV